MPAPQVLAANAQGNAANVLAALSAPGRDAAVADGLPVDFASLVVARTPAADEFAALQSVKTSLDDEGADAQAPADIGALLAEITQPLPPTAVPLMPAAVPAAQLALAASAGPRPDDAAPAAAGEQTGGLALALGKAETAGPGQVPGNGGSAPGEGENGGAPEFRPAAAMPPALGHALPTPGHAGASTAVPAQLVAQPAIHSPQWSGEVGQGLVWMVRNEVQTAQLAINPPHLGPIEITLTLNKDQATAHFASPHSEVRDVLQEALPRLREILEGAGVQLGQADVGDPSRQAFARRDGTPRGEAPAFGLEHATLSGDAAVNRNEPGRLRSGSGLVDTFA
jgi:flagellar hook-length control protein FliK